MAAIGARGRELAELVPDHVLGHIDRDEFVPIVYRERHPHEFRRYGARAGPGLDHALFAACGGFTHSLRELVVDERRFLE